MSLIFKMKGRKNMKKRKMSEIGKVNCGKRYSDNFRENVLRVAKEKSLTSTEVSKLFGIAPVTYKDWVKKAEAKAKAEAEAKALAIAEAKARAKAIKKELSQLVMTSAKLNEAMGQLELELYQLQKELKAS